MEVINIECKGCEFSQYPPCAVQEIYSAANIEDIIEDKKIKQKMHPVCHKNAQTLINNRIERTEACDNCSLCELLCESSAGNDSSADEMDSIVSGSLNILNILFKHRLPEAVVASDVKVKGNAREKRIDLVVKKETSVFLIKILTDIDKCPYYLRAYEDAETYYKIKYSNCSFIKRIVIPTEKKSAANDMGYDCRTLADIIKEIQEE